MLNFLAMAVLGVPNAAILAFIIGLTTTIPMIGGVLGGVLAVLITLMAAPEHTLAVALIAFLVQQFEGNILAPRVMSQRVGLEPLLVIVYTAVGFVMFGVVGALIAVPIMKTVHILLVHLVIEPYTDSLRSVRTEEGLPVIREEARPNRIYLPASPPEPRQNQGLGGSAGGERPNNNAERPAPQRP
ncbi:MAG: AI-2E family transporter [Anaerolineae bacterium]|nr:AI-2E family transporter [Anaerolineae bacterium]